MLVINALNDCANFIDEKTDCLMCMLAAPFTKVFSIWFNDQAERRAHRNGTFKVYFLKMLASMFLLPVAMIASMTWYMM